jgi:secreted trypsin-like serine protease
LFVDYFDEFDPRLIVGLVSWGGDCQPLETRPGVYTRISSYIDWIDLSTEARRKMKKEKL